MFAGVRAAPLPAAPEAAALFGPASTSQPTKQTEKPVAAVATEPTAGQSLAPKSQDAAGLFGSPEPVAVPPATAAQIFVEATTNQAVVAEEKTPTSLDMPEEVAKAEPVPNFVSQDQMEDTPKPSEEQVEFSSFTQSLDEANFFLPEGIAREEAVDPLNVRFLVSKDVLKAELQDIEEKLEDGCSVDLVIKELELRMSLDKLEASLQDNSLPISDYIAQLKDRVLKDKILAFYLRDRQAEAGAVMKRINIMAAEILAAQQNNNLSEERKA